MPCTTHRLRRRAPCSSFRPDRRTLEYFQSLGVTKIITIAVSLIALLSALFLLNYRQDVLPRTETYRKLIPVLSVLFIIAPSIVALGEEILPESFPVRTFLDTHDYMERSALYAENHDDKYANLQAVQLNPADYPNTVVVVIGESETRTLMNAYNPDHVPNTPWLTAMKANPDFTLFTNAYSSVWYTVPVLEHALTESNFYNNKPFNESISIIDMAKKAGYKTYWFSNQGSVGVADTPITLVANTADVSEWVDRDLKESTQDGASYSSSSGSIRRKRTSSSSISWAATSNTATATLKNSRNLTTAI